MERDRRSHSGVLLGLCAIASVALLRPVTANVFSGKAYQKAQQDCVNFLSINEFRLAQYNKFVYPPDRDTMCLIRCIGITLDFWDDTVGFNVSFVEQQFSPLVDARFKKLLSESIASKLELIDPLDNCSRAYYAFRTFRTLVRQLLNSTTPSSTAPFLPLTAVQIVDIIVDCARELNVSAAYLSSLTTGTIEDVPEVRCLIRCAAIRSGVYTDKTGALLENLHTQLNPPGEEKDSFILRQGLCLKRNEQRDSEDQCFRAFRQFFTCLRPDYERFFIANADTVLQTPLFQQQQLLQAIDGSTTVSAMDPMNPLLSSFR